MLNIDVISVFLTCDFGGSGLPKKLIGSDFKTATYIFNNYVGFMLK